MNKTSERKFVDVVTARTLRFSRNQNALTLLEMIMALAVLGIIFAAILPQFRVMFNSWDSKQAAAEILQNGRVLIDHLNNNLSRAVRITAVSPSSQAKGSIEFQNAAGVVQVYDVKPGSNYVEFGTQGSMYELAGPVSSLQFTCYDACDVVTTDVTKIRFVQVATTFPNTVPLGQSKTFTTQAYLRANYQADDTEAGLAKASLSFFEYDAQDGRTPALCQIDDTHYLCAYEGKDGDGWAVVLEVNASTWNVTKKAPLEFDTLDGKTLALIQMDSTHYLCAYRGKDDDGWAVVLTVVPGIWLITAGIPFEFDIQDGRTPALAQIDSTHYLCAYEGKDQDGWACVLEINPLLYTITKKSSFEFDTDKGMEPALAQIDSTHYLCAYHGRDDDGWAIVLEVNPVAWDISAVKTLEFDTQDGRNPALAKIRDTHYLCAYEGEGSDGWVVVLTVDRITYDVNKYTAFEYDGTNGVAPSLIWIKDNYYICAYSGGGSKGKAVALKITASGENIETVASIEFENGSCNAHALVKIDSSYLICAYQGPQDDGWTGVLRYGAPILP